MIRKGDNPEKGNKYNKFIAKSGDGQRGVLLALNEDKTQAIIVAMNSSCTGDVEWGKMYMVTETDSRNYPVVEKQVNSIPNDKGWAIVK